MDSGVLFPGVPGRVTDYRKSFAGVTDRIQVASSIASLAPGPNYVLSTKHVRRVRLPVSGLARREYHDLADLTVAERTIDNLLRNRDATGK